MSFYADAVAHDSGSSRMVENGVTTWMYAKLYKGQRIVSVQLLPQYRFTG